MPPTPPLASTDLIYVLGVPGLPLFFAALPLPCIIENKKIKKNGGGLGTRLRLCGVVEVSGTGELDGINHRVLCTAHGSCCICRKGDGTTDFPCPTLSADAAAAMCIVQHPCCDMAAALAGCRTVLVATGWAISHLVS